MRSIRGTLKALVEREVRHQLNVIFFGRSKGPSMRIGRIIANKPKTREVGNVFPIEEAKKGRKAS